MLLDGTTSGKGRENRVKIGAGDPISLMEVIWFMGARSVLRLPKNVGLKPRSLGRLYAILKTEARVVNLSKNPVA
jgi:hypothetical protein